MASRLPGVEPRARQRHRCDETERERGDGHEAGRSEVCVSEARHRSRSQSPRERKTDDVQHLKRNRQDRRSREYAEPGSQWQPRRPCGRRGHACADRPHRKPRGRDEESDAGVQRHSPRHDDDPVGLDPREDEHEPGSAAGCVADGCSPVVVESRQAARRETGEEMECRSRHHPAQSLGGGVLRDDSTRCPSRDPRSAPSGTRARSTSGTATSAIAIAKPATSPARRCSARARVRSGRTAIRIACEASTTTMKTPYAAKKPSVSSVRPNSRAITTPAIADSAVTTSAEVAVSAALLREPRPGESVRLRTDAEGYAPCRTTVSGQAARSTNFAASSATSTRAAPCSSRGPTASWARTSRTAWSSSERRSMRSCARTRAVPSTTSRTYAIG